MIRSVKVISVSVLSALLAVSLLLLWISEHYVVPIMMYHHVTAVTPSEGNWVSPKSFEQQMAYLTQHHYKVITLDELVSAIQKKEKLSHKTVVLTFDDGYDDNYTQAYPILKKYQFSATIFLIANKINADGFLNLKQIEEMLTNGINFGSHTLSHPYLPSLSPPEQEKEIRESKARIGQALNTSIEYFCYPIGGFSDDIKRMVKEAGYKAALTTNRGFARSNQDVYELKRIRFVNNDNSLSLGLKLSGYYNFFRKPKGPY